MTVSKELRISIDSMVMTDTPFYDSALRFSGFCRRVLYLLRLPVLLGIHAVPGYFMRDFMIRPFELQKGAGSSRAITIRTILSNKSFSATATFLVMI